MTQLDKDILAQKNKANKYLSLNSYNQEEFNLIIKEIRRLQDLKMYATQELEESESGL